MTAKMPKGQSTGLITWLVGCQNKPKNIKLPIIAIWIYLWTQNYETHLKNYKTGIHVLEYVHTSIILF